MHSSQMRSSFVKMLGGPCDMSISYENLLTQSLSEQLRRYRPRTAMRGRLFGEKKARLPSWLPRIAVHAARVAPHPHGNSPMSGFCPKAEVFPLVSVGPGLARSCLRRVGLHSDDSNGATCRLTAYTRSLTRP